MLCKLVLGDMFSDGHSITKDILIDSNYDSETLWEAYKKSCKKLGIQFNSPYNDFTELGLDEDHDNRALFLEYGDNSIPKEYFDILDKAGCLEGIDGEEDDYEIEDDNSYAFYDEKVVARLIMNFISLSMPEDFKYEFVDCSIINMNCEIGYGIFFR